MRVKLRASEWIALVYFAYVALISPLFPDRAHFHWHPLWVLAGTALLIWLLATLQTGERAKAIGVIRDWLPLALTLLAFREMEWFVPRAYDVVSETAWMRWDDLLLRRWGLTHGIEIFGPVLSGYLELCYLLVYGVGAYGLAILYFERREDQSDRFTAIYMAGTLLAYALFPYFPSQPPRIAFAGLYAPHVATVFRSANLYLLREAAIHTGVFPSAHVSSVFSAAWALFLLRPKYKAIAWLMLFYAVSVAVATIYGRYHYATDAIAGLAISLVAGAAGLFWRKQHWAASKASIEMQHTEAAP